MSGVTDCILNSLGSGAVAGLVIGLLVRRYCSSYLDKKGENLATKEDIAAITREVERVRLVYSAELEQIKARHQLRPAALDRRLAVHQEAFTLWRELHIATVLDFEVAAKKCGDW